MDPRSYELAAEFCSLIGATSLLAYLEIDGSTSADDARAKLKKRRKYMQGMQGNPKYKQEALFLIKHFRPLNDVLGDIPAYVSQLQRQAESEHLPVIEMTIRGVLAAGGLNQEQRDFLQHNAAQLGMSEATFDELLRRLALEAGVPLQGGLPTPIPAPGRQSGTDLYAILGIDNHASVEQIDEAYAARRATVPGDQTDMLRKLDIARKVLSNEVARMQYDQTAARTGPPARQREHLPTRPSTTAPPIRPRTEQPMAPPVAAAEESRLEILGDPVRILPTSGRGSEQLIRIRNGGVGAMPGKALADVPWLQVDPKQLDPVAAEQDVMVRVLTDQVPDGASTAVVTILTDRGERARVVFEVQHTNNTNLIVGGLALGVLAVAAGIGIALQFL